MIIISYLHCFVICSKCFNMTFSKVSLKKFAKLFYDTFFHSFPFMCFGPSVCMYVSGGCDCSVSLQPLFIKRLSLHSPLDHFFYPISRCQMPLSLALCSFKRSPVRRFFLLYLDYQPASSLVDAHDISVVWWTQNLETTAFYVERLVMTDLNLELLYYSAVYVYF